MKRGYRIHGAAGKLFKEFLREASPSSVISYMDFNHSTGRSFLQDLGFRELRPSGPSVVWHSPMSGKRVMNSALIRLGADKLLKTSYGSFEECGLDNETIMLLEGFLKVHTAGNRIFKWVASEAVA